MELIKKDLDSDDVFTLHLGGPQPRQPSDILSPKGGLNPEYESDKPLPEEEWLETSVEDDLTREKDPTIALRDENGQLQDNSALDLTGVQELKHIEECREQMDNELKRQAEPPSHDQVLLSQLLDMELKK